MKIAIFELIMPNVGSWNGKWSGSSKNFTIKKRLPKEKEHLIGKSFYYDFGDGWGARIVCRAPILRERATGEFCGYTWMIDSILKNERITRED